MLSQGSPKTIGKPKYSYSQPLEVLLPPLGPRDLIALGPIFCSNSDQGRELWGQGEGKLHQR